MIIFKVTKYGNAVFIENRRMLNIQDFFYWFFLDFSTLYIENKKWIVQGNFLSRLLY